VVSAPRLLQLRVLRFGFLQDGNVGVSVFPQRERIFVGGERPPRWANDRVTEYTMCGDCLGLTCVAVVSDVLPSVVIGT
jgi:hypothetical protein